MQDVDDFDFAFGGSEALTSNFHGSTDNLQFTPALRQHLISSENIDDLRHLYQLNPCLKPHEAGRLSSASPFQSSCILQHQLFVGLGPRTLRITYQRC